MRIATGIDFIDIKSIKNTLTDPAQLQRILHPSDIVRNDALHIAGRIALKEAAIKAFKRKPGSWLDVHIHTKTDGSTSLVLDPPVDGLVSVDCSLSHHAQSVVAIVVALFDDEKD